MLTCRNGRRKDLIASKYLGWGESTIYGNKSDLFASSLYRPVRASRGCFRGEIRGGGSLSSSSHSSNWAAAAHDRVLRQTVDERQMVSLGLGPQP